MTPPGSRCDMAKSRPLADRFWEKVDVRGRNECWEWQASIRTDGYGQICVVAQKLSTGEWLSKPKPAHRVAFELRNGPLQPGAIVRHTCDNPKCCNPRHLVAGTQLENVRDMHRKGRVRATGRKLDRQKAALLRERAQGVEYGEVRKTAQRLAKEFGVTTRTVLDVLNWKTWAW